MSTWSPQNAIITNLGNSLLASARVGLGTIQLTRVVARENFESSMATARAYTSADITPASIAQEGHLMKIRVSESPDPEEEVETSLVTVRFSNDDLEDSSETYNLRQIILFAVLLDAETHEATDSEVPYMVCQCDDSSDCDVMPAREVNPTSLDYDIYVIHSGVDDFTIEVRTEGYVWQDDFDDYKADVDARFDEIDSDIEDSTTAIKEEGNTYTSWTPSYDEYHNEMTKVAGTSVTGEEDSLSFNRDPSATYSYEESLATGKKSSAFGGGTEVLGDYSFAANKDNYIGANAVKSAVFGTENSIHSGTANFVAGGDNEVTGSFNTVFGYSNILSNNAYFTLLSGVGLKAESERQNIFGWYNEVDNDKAFIIGGGSSEANRENIFTVDWFGSVKAKDIKVDDIYVGTIYNPDGTEKEIGGASFIKQGTGTDSFITNDLTNNQASAPNSTAFGKSTRATGYYSMSLNEMTLAGGRNSVAMGYSSSAMGEDSFAQGYESVASAKLSVVLGSNKSSIDNNNPNSLILGGYDNTMEADSQKGYNLIAVSAGVDITNSENNVVLGNKPNSLLEIENGGYNFIVGGSATTVNTSKVKDSENVNAFINNDCEFQNSENIFAAGKDLKTTYAENCTLLGEALTITGSSSASKAENQTVLGMYNNVSDSNNKLLVVGNGTSTNRHNALTIDKSGNIYINEDSTSLNTKIAGAIQSSQKGVANGVAELDSTGKVPVSQVPGGISSMIEGYYYNGEFYEESTHETQISHQSGALYVDLPTNKTYRWSGSQYTEISESLALGTTSETACRGDWGYTAYLHATDSSRLTTATASGLYKVAATAEGHIASLTAVEKSDITALGIPAQDTTYQSKAEASGGTEVSLVTTGDKYNWNRAYKQVVSDYAKAASASALANTDTVSEALGKLEKRTELSEGKITTNETNILSIQDHYKYGNRILFEQESIPTGTIAYGSTWIDGKAVRTYNRTTNIVGGVIQQGSWNAANLVKIDSTTRCRLSNSITVQPSTTYTIRLVSPTINNARVLLQYRDSNDYTSSESGWQATLPYTFTTPSNCHKATIILSTVGDLICTPTDFGNLQINEGNTALSYEVPSWSSTDSEIITPALAECVDNGVKNKVYVDNSGTFTASGSSRSYDIPINVTGDIAISFGSLTSTDTDSDSCAIVFLNSSNVGFLTISMNRGNNVSEIVKLTDTATKVRLYPASSYNESAGDTVTWNNLMICDESLWKVSQNYQPFALSNSELTAKEQQNENNISKYVYETVTVNLSSQDISWTAYGSVYASSIIGLTQVGTVLSFVLIDWTGIRDTDLTLIPYQSSSAGNGFKMLSSTNTFLQSNSKVVYRVFGIKQST